MEGTVWSRLGELVLAGCSPARCFSVVGGSEAVADPTRRGTPTAHREQRRRTHARHPRPQIGHLRQLHPTQRHEGRRPPQPSTPVRHPPPKQRRRIASSNSSGADLASPPNRRQTTDPPTPRAHPSLDFMAGPLSVTISSAAISLARAPAQSWASGRPMSASAVSMAACRAPRRSVAPRVRVIGHAKATLVAQSRTPQPPGALARGLELAEVGLPDAVAALWGSNTSRRAAANWRRSARWRSGCSSPQRAIARFTLEGEPTSQPSTAAIAAILR